MVVYYKRAVLNRLAELRRRVGWDGVFLWLELLRAVSVLKKKHIVQKVSVGHVTSKHLVIKTLNEKQQHIKGMLIVTGKKLSGVGESGMQSTKKNAGRERRLCVLSVSKKRKFQPVVYVMRVINAENVDCALSYPGPPSEDIMSAILTG